MLKQPCIPEINPIWSFGSFFFNVSRLGLLVFLHLYLKDILILVFLSCDVFALISGNTGLIEIGKFSCYVYFLEMYIYYFKTFDKTEW